MFHAQLIWYIHTARKRGLGQEWDQRVKKNAEIFTVVQDRDRDKYPLIDIVPVLFPVPPFLSLAPGPTPMQCE